MNSDQGRNALIVGVVFFFVFLILAVILLLLPGMFFKVLGFLFSEAA